MDPCSEKVPSQTVVRPAQSPLKWGMARNIEFGRGCCRLEGSELLLGITRTLFFTTGFRECFWS